MHQYLLGMWKMHRVTELQINNAVTKGYITQEQANEILQSEQD